MNKTRSLMWVGGPLICGVFSLELCFASDHQAVTHAYAANYLIGIQNPYASYSADYSQGKGSQNIELLLACSPRPDQKPFSLGRIKLGQSLKPVVIAGLYLPTCKGPLEVRIGIEKFAFKAVD